MGYKKATISRDSISGLWQQNDIDTNSEVSVNELNARMAARQTAINDAIRNDWPENMTATSADIDDVTYGNAGEKFPRPSDVSSKGGDRYGISVTPGKQAAKEAPRSNSKQSK